MWSHVLCTLRNRLVVKMDSVVATFTVRARGIKFYDVAPRTLVPGLAVVFQRKPSRYDANAVGLLVPSRRYGLGTAFLGHVEREAARFVSKLLSDPELETTA